PPRTNLAPVGRFGEVSRLSANAACRDEQCQHKDPVAFHVRSPTGFGSAFRSKRAKLVTTAKHTAGTTNEIAGLVASRRRPWINGMIAPPTIAITNPAAPNFVADPSPL